MKQIFIISVSLFVFLSSTSYAAHYWEGNVDHQWDNPGNWDLGTVPGSGDVVYIVAGTPNGCWVATDNQYCSSLLIMPGASLRIYDEHLTVYGAMQIWGNLQMDNSNGFLIVHNHIKWEIGSTASISAYVGIRVYDDWEFNSGSNVHLDDGYVQFDGNNNNSIICKSDNSYFNTLVVTNTSGEIQFSGASNEALNIKTNFAITSGSVFRSYSSQNIILDGIFAYNDGHFYMNSGTFIFHGSPTNVDCNTGDYFNHLVINSYSHISMVSDLTINGNLTINSGNLVSNNHTILIAGNWVNSIRPSGFYEGTGTVVFTGTSNKSCSGEHFYNLTIDKSSTSNYVDIYPTYPGPYTETNVANKTQISNGYIKMNNNSHLSTKDLTILNGAKLDASGASDPEISISGNWLDYNTSTSGFIEGYSRVSFIGGNTQFLQCPSLSSYDFFNITLNKSVGYFTSSLDLNFYGHASIESGNWSFNTSSVNHYFYGDIILAGGIFVEQCNTIFKGYSHQNIYFQSSALHDMGPMIIDKPHSGYTVTVPGDWDLYSSGGLIVESGLFILDGSTFQCENNLTINSDGIFAMDYGSTLQIEGNFELEVNSGGEFSTNGSAANPNLITRYNSGYYSFTINYNAVIGAAHTIFEFMGTDGINVGFGGFVDTNFPFNYCTFRNSSFGSTLLKLNCYQSITIANASFPNNNWGSFYNVGRSTSAGVITFSWADGFFSGEPSDSDPYNKINWEYEPTKVSGKVFLEGPFNSTAMNTGANAILPLSQPYSGTPWNYTGSENVASIPSPDIVDWVLLDLRTSSSGPSHAVAEATRAQRAAFLMSDGSLVETDGSTEIEFDCGIGSSENVYLVVTHRNHLPILSGQALVLNGDVYNGDLSASSSGVYGGLNACKYLASGIYGMIAGDGNSNGAINENDAIPWRQDAGTQGYFKGDMDLDGQINNQDKDDYIVPNIGMTSQLPY